MKNRTPEICKIATARRIYAGRADANLFFTFFHQPKSGEKGTVCWYFHAVEKFKTL